MNSLSKHINESFRPQNNIKIDSLSLANGLKKSDFGDLVTSIQDLKLGDSIIIVNRSDNEWRDQVEFLGDSGNAVQLLFTYGGNNEKVKIRYSWFLEDISLGFVYKKK